MILEQLAQARGLALDRAQSPEEHAVAVATRIADGLQKALDARGKATLALSGGRGPAAFLRQLDDFALDWRRVTITLADERWVPETSPDSNAGLLRRCLPKALSQAHWLPLYRGVSLEQDAQSVSSELEALLPLDVVVLGMGEDGHTASLFPHHPGLERMLSVSAERLCCPIPATAERLARLTLTGRALRTAGLQLLAISGDDKQRVLIDAFTAKATERPIAAFLAPPLDIFYSPQG